VGCRGWLGEHLQHLLGRGRLRLRQRHAQVVRFGQLTLDGLLLRLAQDQLGLDRPRDAWKLRKLFKRLLHAQLPRLRLCRKDSPMLLLLKDLPVPIAPQWFGALVVQLLCSDKENNIFIRCAGTEPMPIAQPDQARVG
jgi:hypothetical protein